MPVIGIDLGTTNTAIAVLEDGKPRVLADDRGHKVLPSCVSAKGGGRFVVGHAAQSMILTRPERTVYATKRLIGRRFDSPEVAEAQRRMHYAMREAADGGVELQVGEDWLSPIQVAAVVLQVAKTISEKALKSPVEEAVITVPAYFNHIQRQATLEAAERAGLRCERLLNEPTAAALAYGHRRTVDKTILVFDLGGGTFDVSVLRLANSVYEMLATLGDTFLGGEDFDFSMVDHLAEKFVRQHGLDPRSDRGALQRLKDASEKAKCELSFSERAIVNLSQLMHTHPLEVTLGRRTLEEITAPLLDRVMAVTKRAVSDAQLEPRDIDEVIFVGGQTRMPRLRELVTSFFGREPSRAVHPEEAVAIGAAVHAASLDDPESPAAVLLDVTPFDLGIDSAGGVFSPIIRRNSRVPASESKTFATVNDEQTSVRVTARQGESRFSAENEFLGEFVMDGLTAAPRFQTKVDVGFRLDTNGILHVSAVERGTGERKQILIRNYAEHARGPKLPTEAEAAAERARRAAGEDAPVAVQPAQRPPRPSILDSLFGRFTKKGAGGASSMSSENQSTDPNRRTPADSEPGRTLAPTLVAPIPDAPPSGLRSPAAPTIVPSMSDAVVVAERRDDVGQGAAPEPRLPPRNSPSADMTFEAPEDEEPDLRAPLEDDPEKRGSGGHFGASEPRDVPPSRSARATAPRPSDDVFALSDDSASSLDPEDDGIDLGAFGDDGAPGFGDPLGSGQGSAASSPAEQSSLDGGDLFGGDLFGGGAFGDAPAEPPGAAFGWDGAASSGRSRPAPAPTAVPEMDGMDLDFSALGFSNEDLEAAAALDSALPEPAPGTSSKVPSTPEQSAPRPPRPASPHSVPEATIAPVKRPDPRRSLPPEGAPGRPAIPAKIPSQWGSGDFDFPLGDPSARQLDRSGKKPARVKLSYKQVGPVVEEYLENLRKGGAFIKTEKPLEEGRLCVFEVRAPGLEPPLVINALVVPHLPGDSHGMRVRYHLLAGEGEEMERRLNELG